MENAAKNPSGEPNKSPLTVWPGSSLPVVIP